MVARQRHLDLHEFEASMVYRVPEQLELFAKQRNPVAKKWNPKNVMAT